MPLDENYISKLKKRSQESHVYQKHQLVGLEIADLLDDRKHKALYIKLAKQGNGEHLLGVAKEISKKKEVKNKGAYFMKVIQVNK